MARVPEVPFRLPTDPTVIPIALVPEGETGVSTVSKNFFDLQLANGWVYPVSKEIYANWNFNARKIKSKYTSTFYGNTPFLNYEMIQGAVAFNRNSFNKGELVNNQIPYGLALAPINKKSDIYLTSHPLNLRLFVPFQGVPENQFTMYHDEVSANQGIVSMNRQQTYGIMAGMLVIGAERTTLADASPASYGPTGVLFGVYRNNVYAFCPNPALQSIGLYEIEYETNYTIGGNPHTDTRIFSITSVFY